MQRSGDDRRDFGNGIRPDDDFKGIERAGQWRAKRRTDPGARARTDQPAQIGAAQAQTLPQPRCQPAAHLRICRFQPDRRTAAV